MAIQADQATQLLSARITGQGDMSGTSVIRDTPCLVLLSEGVCPAETGVEMNRHVRAYVKFILFEIERRNKIVIYKYRYK